MNQLERIWELLSLFFGSLLRLFERGVTSLFGSSNARYVKRLQNKVDAINGLEPKFTAMTNEELKEQTERFRERLEAGETEDDILIEHSILKQKYVERIKRKDGSIQPIQWVLPRPRGLDSLRDIEEKLIESSRALDDRLLEKVMDT